MALIDHKISVFTGINDIPVEPTSGEAGNGSHLIAKHNNLIDDLLTVVPGGAIYLNTPNVNVDSTLNGLTVILGKNVTVLSFPDPVENPTGNEIGATGFNCTFINQRDNDGIFLNRASSTVKSWRCTNHDPSFLPYYLAYDYFDSLGRLDVFTNGFGVNLPDNPSGKILQARGDLAGKGSHNDSDPDFNSVALFLKMQGTNNSTTIIDSSTNGLTVNVISGAKLSSTQKKTDKTSLVLNGTTDYLTIDDTAALNISSETAYAIECYFYLNDLTADQVIASKRTDTLDEWEIRVTTTSLQFTVWNPSAVTATISTSVTTGEWHHVICGRQSGNGIQIYLDEGSSYGGLESSAAATPPTPTHTAAPINVGCEFATGSAYFNGYISHLRISKSDRFQFFGDIATYDKHWLLFYPDLIHTNEFPPQP